MDDFGQETIKLATQTDQYLVAPGGSLEVPVALTNLGGMPEQVRIGVEGVPLVWVSTDQPILLLQPGETRQITLIIKPPAPPEAHAGRYNLVIRAASTLQPNRSSLVSITLTVAGYEVKGRVGVLLNGLQYAVVPGDQLVIPAILINQGLSVDTFQMTIEDLPEGWVALPGPSLRLGPGETQDALLVVQPPRHPATRAGRHPFRILVASQEAPDQSASIDCTLTVAVFIQFNAELEAAQPDQDLPAKVLVRNSSNVTAKFQVTWSSPKDSLAFEPASSQQISIISGESAKLEFAARPAQRLWVGGEKSFAYTVTVQSSDRQTQTLKGDWIAKGLLPVWALAAGGVALLLLCLCLCLSLLVPRILQRGEATATPGLNTTTTAQLIPTATGPIPTATQSQDDQKPLLVGRKWYLVAYNDMRSVPGVQEAFTLFNPDGTLIGYTGCKDLSAAYQTTFNQISISNLSLGRGTCPDPALQEQEDAMVAIMRSARSYFVADTALQLAGDAGFLNYSLTPVNRPEDVLPPQAVIQAAPQSQVGQIVVFDGSASTGSDPLVSWKWDFGDGSQASGIVVQHSYRDPGTFTVTLTVTDQRGQTSSSTQPIHILALPTATAQPTAQPTIPQPTLPPPTPVPTLPPPTLPPPPEQPTPTSEPLPEPDPPQAQIQGPRNGFLGEPVEFDASSSRPGGSPIVSYSWSFGDGVNLPASPDPRASTIYNRTGDYEVTVIVVDGNGLSSNASTHISINARLNTAVWSLSGINGQPVLPGTAVTLQFLQGQLTGFAGCNTYNSSYTATDNGDGTYSVTIDRITTSRLACPADIMTQEQNYLAALQQVSTAAIQENMITLTYPNGTLTYFLISPR